MHMCECVRAWLHILLLCLCVNAYTHHTHFLIAFTETTWDEQAEEQPAAPIKLYGKFLEKKKSMQQIVASLPAPM
jgi:hypothetical protein